MQLLFGPNWEYGGEILDHDKAKKQLYKWKRDEEKRRSIGFAQEPSIESHNDEDNQSKKKPANKERHPGIAQWVEETKENQRRGSRFVPGLNFD